MFNILFRKDLELKNQWHHRLFKVVIIFFIIYFTFNQYNILLIQSKNHGIKISNIEDRLGDNVSMVGDLLIGNEFYSNSGWSSELSTEWSNQVYCSNELYNIDNLEYIIKKTGISTMMNEARKKLTIDQFSSLIKSERVTCLIIDKFGVDFLNPMTSLKDFSIYKPSIIGYLKDSIFLGDSIIRLIINLFLLFILYYQIILFIIYGKYQKRLD